MEKIRLGDIATTITKGTTPTTIGFPFVDTGINFVKIESIDEAGNFLPDRFAHIKRMIYYPPLQGQSVEPPL